MSVWNFFMGGCDFGHFVAGGDIPDSKMTWDIDFVDSGATDLEVFGDDDYVYLSYSLPLLKGDAFGVEKISLIDGQVVWKKTYQKSLYSQTFCHDDFIFSSGIVIDKVDGSVNDVLSFPGCGDGFYYSFISDGKVFLSEKGVGELGGVWCELSNVGLMQNFNGGVVCCFSDGRVVKSEGERLDVFSSGSWRSNNVGLNLKLGQVVSYQDWIICFENGLHIFEVDKDGGLTKKRECELPVMSALSILMRSDDSAVLFDPENGLVIVYSMVSGVKQEFRLKLDAHIGRSCCIKGGVLYGTFDDFPIGYSLATGEVVWKSDYKISARTVVATRAAVLYQFIAGAVQAYSVNFSEE